jgi:hypothetical protein
MRDELRDGDDGSLAWGLLFGLASAEPGSGKELGYAVSGPIGGDPDQRAENHGSVIDELRREPLRGIREVVLM